MILSLLRCIERSFPAPLTTCKDEARATLQLVPVADLVKAAAQLAVCTTAAELMDLKPDVGAVTIGGNQVGRQHSI